MNIRPLQDNVLICLLPDTGGKTAGGIHIPQNVMDPRASRQTRTALVVASGPGYRDPLLGWTPNELKPGDMVIVDRLAGQDYAFDISAPRTQPKGAEFERDRQEYRIIRESEAHGVIEEG